MLFDSSLRKDLARNFVATVVVIVTIVMTIVLIRTLGQASRGAINPAEVLLIMGFNLLSQLTTILALSLFITVIATVSRMYSDSEMVIWFNSGRGVMAFVPVLLRFAWPVVLAIALLALFAWPWSNRQIQELQNRYDKRGDVERVTPGQFQESAGGKRVFFIDKDAPDKNTGTNVFISNNEGALETITTAREGRIENRGDDRFLSLARGEQWLLQRDTGESRWTRFERYELLIEADRLSADAAVASKQMPSLALWRQPTAVNLGELSWRLGLGLCSLNFVLLALPLSAVNPRVGRSYQFGVALLVFVVYYNLVNIGQNWIGHGRIGLLPWLAALHGGVFALACLWLWLRHRQWSWRDLWPRAALQRTEAA
ncbi:MAG: Lipopolysaccharide export system permease protein LptF [Pseudomonadota bacterium]